MSNCKHDMELSYDASFEVCAWCGESELDIAKAEIAALKAENERLKRIEIASQIVVNTAEFDCDVSVVETQDLRDLKKALEKSE